jgi:hypothetical protein
MSWEEYCLARQLLVEERIGTRIREAKAIEDAKHKASAKHLKR